MLTYYNKNFSHVYVTKHFMQQKRIWAFQIVSGSKDKSQKCSIGNIVSSTVISLYVDRW